MQRPHRARKALCLLHLHVRVVVDAKRNEREYDASDKTRARAVRQHPHEQGHADAGEDET
ncbi:MAG: hypothetical protein DMF97_19805 [Acidobacteria bacterium]|nr:MAG: hypothetical protein DMF97_19805 [Acidobacteriota bacterium]